MQSEPRSDWHVIVETLSKSKVKAWIAEFPDCHVVEDSPESAIQELERLFKQRMANIQVLPLELSSQTKENPWLRLSGMLKDDDSFATWSDRYWDDKSQDYQADETLSLEECLEVM